MFLNHITYTVYVLAILVGYKCVYVYIENTQGPKVLNVSVKFEIVIKIRLHMKNLLKVSRHIGKILITAQNINTGGK